MPQGHSGADRAPDPALDVIGDIHGQADALDALLSRLGYVHKRGVWRAPEGRMAVFVGDFIDRGSDGLRVVATVRAMIEAGSARAVMGNHELNALQFHTPDHRTGEPLRAHSDKNTAQHRAYLKEAGRNPGAHADALAFFQSLPLFLEIGGVRIVHACWHDETITAARSLLAPGVRLDEDTLQQTGEGGAVYPIVETVLKGPETALPDGVIFHDKDGHPRSRVRLAWWRQRAERWQDLALCDADAMRDVSTPLPADATDWCYPADAPAICFGHYWLAPDSPLVPMAKNAVCVDFSAGVKGTLAAFRFESDRPADLSSGRFEAVSVS